MVQKLGISEEVVGSMTTDLYYNHGTTLAGLAVRTKTPSQNSVTPDVARLRTSQIWHC
jgi:hypothetical protein